MDQQWTQEQSSGSSGRVCLPLRQRGDCRGEAPLLPSTKMFMLNTTVFWFWEMVHVQVPLSCTSSPGSESLWPLPLLLLPGPFHCTEGLLPEGASTVRVSCCPCSRRMLLLSLLLPVSHLAVTVEGTGHLCHTHAIPQGEGRSQETQSISPLPLLRPLRQRFPLSPSGRPSSLPFLLSLLPLAPALLPTPPPPRFLPFPL